MSTNLRHAGFKAMGTYCEIQLYEASRISARRMVRRLIDEVNRLESKYTRYREDSFLSKINRSAGDQTGIKIDVETLKLFEHAQTAMNRATGCLISLREFCVAFGISVANGYPTNPSYKKRYH